jgi:hypothetical protein
LKARALMVTARSTVKVQVTLSSLVTVIAARRWDRLIAALVSGVQ